MARRRRARRHGRCRRGHPGRRRRRRVVRLPVRRHLHGHHAVVLSRDGVAATGSPWWVDSLEVRDGEAYEVAFVADDPGIWMDHCHNLPHAVEGLVAHLLYEGVSEPFRIGGPAGNRPE
nr:multicopper oxidase domain-containing protein [Glycomyces sp. YM15]